METRVTNRSLVLTIVLLGGAGCASLPNEERAAHVGLGFVYGIERFDLDEAEQDAGLELAADDALGVELRLGRRVHANADLELRAGLHEAFEVDASDGSSAEVELRALTFDLKLHEDPHDRWFPDLDERWRPYLVLGLGVLQAEADDAGGFLRAFDDSAAVVRAGLGLEVLAGDSFAWFVEGGLMEPTGDLEGLSVIQLTAGIQWRF